MLIYFQHTHKEKELLLFASGKKPALIEGIVGYNDDIFDLLRSSRISVAELFTDKAGNIIINNEALKKVITQHKNLFITRLEMPPNSTVDDIFSQISKSWNNKLRSKNSFADLRHIIIGGTEKDAYHYQLVQDIKQSLNGRFYSGCAGSLEEYKELLKKAVYNPKFSYSKYSEHFKTDLIKMIDSLTEESFAHIIEEPIHVFKDAEFERRQAEALKRLAEKLYDAKEFGSIIRFS